MLLESIAVLKLCQQAADLAEFLAEKFTAGELYEVTGTPADTLLATDATVGL